jgi:hypothetical protein
VDVGKVTGLPCQRSCRRVSNSGSLLREDLEVDTIITCTAVRTAVKLAVGKGFKLAAE